MEPLGSNQVQAVDVRVIAATSRDLGQMTSDGTFRSDLYYRLNVMEIAVPPLRERLADLGILCESLLADLSDGPGLGAEITDEALALLARHHWPGNIRELRNVLERALTLNENAETLDRAVLAQVLPDLEPLSEPATGTDNGPGNPFPGGRQTLADAVASAERAAIESALAASRGNRSQAARLLGISRSVLYQKLAKLS